jgi:hypothetical protein
VADGLSVNAGYEISSAASGDEGLEGFAVLVDGRRVGRVAALNRTPDGLVVVADLGDAYKPVPARFIARIETVGQRIRLTPDGETALARASTVEPVVQQGDSPRIVRHIPRELDPLLVAGESVRTRRSRLWYAGGACVVAGGVGAMAGPVLAAEGIGGDARWLWVALPVAVLVLGARLLWAAMGRDSPARLSRRDKAADAVSAIFGISPRTRKRG